MVQYRIIITSVLILLHKNKYIPPDGLLVFPIMLPVICCHLHQIVYHLPSTKDHLLQVVPCIQHKHLTLNIPFQIEYCCEACNKKQTLSRQHKYPVADTIIKNLPTPLQNTKNTPDIFLNSFKFG